MIPRKIKTRFAGDSGMDAVSQEIDVLFPGGEKRRVLLRLGAPFRKPDRVHGYAWWIRSELENLEVTAGPLAGCGPLDTLAAGLRWIEGRLAWHEKKAGCRYLWPGTDQPFEFREILKTSPSGRDETRR